MFLLRFLENRDYRLCSPDVILSSFGELSTEPDYFQSESRISSTIILHLPDLPSGGSSNGGQIDKSTRHVFDYDDQFIPAEK